MKTRRLNLSEDLSSTTRTTFTEDGRGNALPIPTDLIIDIFSRLPVRSIATCRCVSKIWGSLLRLQDFTELFLSRSRTRPKLLLAYLKDRDLFFFSAPHPDENNSSPLVVTYLSKLSFDAYFGKGGLFELNGLDHSLVGLTNRWDIEGMTAAVICNPSTGQTLPLRRVKSSSLFGYDLIDKQVMVLSSMSEEYQVMTLGTGKVSQKIINFDRLGHYLLLSKVRCIDGVLYHKAIEKSTKTYMLVSFDVRSEMFSFIKVQKLLLIAGTVVNCNGKLGLLVSEKSFDYVDESSTSVNLWVLEDIEKQEWSEHVYLLPPLWKGIVGSEELRFVGMTGRNEIVMGLRGFPPRPMCLVYFNFERSTVVRVAVQGMNLSEYDQVHIFLDHVENVELM